MLKKILILVILFGSMSVASSAGAAIVHPNDIALDGDYSIAVNDPLKVTAIFDGTFDDINYVQITMYLNDDYSPGESYQFSFFNDSGNPVSTVTHSNSSPNAYSYIGYMTNSNTVGSLFLDGNATFELAMLAGSVNVSSIAINIDGDFTPTVVPLPPSLLMFGSALLGLTGLKFRSKPNHI